MTFDEMMLKNQNISDNFNNLFNKYRLFAEASYREYKINLKESKLKVIEESGTTDDLIYLESEAKEGFLVRSGKTIKKMFDAFITWIKNVIGNIKDFFSKKTTQDAITSAKTAAKTNPKLKNQKIEIDDYNKINKIYGKHESAISKKIAAMRSKRFTGKDKEELEKIESDYEKDLKTAKKMKNAVIFTTAIAMIGVLIKNLSKVQKDTEALANKNVNYQTTDNPEDMEAYVDALAIQIRIQKDKSNHFQKIIKDIFNKIKGFGTKSKQMNVDLDPKQMDEYLKSRKNKPTTESTVDPESYINNILDEIKESTKEFDSESYLESLESEIFSYNDISVIESTKSSNSLEEYLYTLEKEIENINTEDTPYAESVNENNTEYVTVEQYLESMESELF